MRARFVESQGASLAALGRPARRLVAALAALALAACGDPTIDALTFDQGPSLSVEAGESVNLSVTMTAARRADRAVWWSASCGQVMGLERRGSYVAPDAAGPCAVVATSVADPSVSATLRVEVTPPTGGGAARWTRQVASDHNDVVRRIAADPDGGIVVLIESEGDLDGPARGDLDLVVRRYDGAGAMSWSTRIATESREYGGGVAVGADGAIFVVGSTFGALGSASLGEFDAFLVRLSPDGAVDWVRQFGTDRTDTAQAVAVGPDGDVWIAGWTEGSLAGPNQGGPDGFVRRFDPDGEARWTRQIGGDGLDYLIAIALDGAGAVVAGNTTGRLGDASGGGIDWFAARVYDDGEIGWLRQRGAATDDRAYGVAARPEGGVVVAGALGDHGFAMALDGSGAEIWTHAIATGGEDLAQAVAVTPAGDAVIVGFTSGDLGTPNVGFFDAFTMRLDPSGARVWVRRLGSAADDYGWALTALADGDVAIGGRTDGALSDGAGLGGDGFLRRMGP
jgi:hypothetical protein